MLVKNRSGFDTFVNYRLTSFIFKFSFFKILHFVWNYNNLNIKVLFNHIWKHTVFKNCRPSSSVTHSYVLYRWHHFPSQLYGLVLHNWIFVCVRVCMCVFMFPVNVRMCEYFTYFANGLCNKFYQHGGSCVFVCVCVCVFVRVCMCACVSVCLCEPDLIVPSQTVSALGSHRQEVKLLII